MNTERDNFYLLLELSLEPPETNDEVIWEAVQKKKAEWSRLRNHPTKGIQAQKYISLIPEIERVMMNTESRQKEAVAAIQILKKGKDDKFIEIDRHIDILLGKGYVQKEEVEKLAEIHGIDPQEIKNRINLKLEEKLQRADQEICIRMAKGYLTEADLSKIAGRHGLSVDQIRQRVRPSMIKSDTEKIEPIKPLDKSIEKSILDNLKIIKKTSLYHFLDAPMGADLKLLQEKSSAKKRELSSLSKKDADVTAGTILIGHCLTIFKNEESRNAYDVSLATARLASLYSDIDVAAIDGKIRPEYFDILTQKAMEFGMDPDEAEQFIETYCISKNYVIEKKQVPIQVQKSRVRPVIIWGCAAAVLVLAGILYGLYQKSAAESEFQAMMEKVDAQTAPEEKIKILKQYVKTHKQNKKHTQQANIEIKELESRIITQKLNAATALAEKAVADGNIRQAISIYQEYIQSNPPEPQKKQAQNQIQRLSEQIEKKDFEEVSALALQGAPDQKMAAFQRYLAQHPDGPHKADVEKWIQEMSGEYYIFTKKMLDSCQQQSDWKTCVELCENFIRIYDNSHADQLKQLLPTYQENLRNDIIFKNLLEKAGQQGDNYAAAQQIYKDFLAAYPNTPLKQRIQGELTRLSELAALAAMEAKKADMRRLLAASGGRFSEIKDGVVLDSKTGLMWCLVDAKTTALNECIVYESAKHYVETLKTAGYTDWRLPTPAELSGIYKAAPAFPVLNEDECFWSSESFTGYADGWHIKVSTLCKEKGGGWEILQKDSKECANVRAVRGR